MYLRHIPCMKIVSFFVSSFLMILGFPDSSVGKKKIRLQCRRPLFSSWVRKIPWRRERLPTPVFWPEEFHGPYSPWSHRVEHDWVTFTHFWWFFCKILKMNLSHWLFKIELGEVPWWLGFGTFIVAVWVQSLVGELRFYILQATRHSKKKTPLN